MIIVKFYSGIGNKLYQYVVYKGLKEKYPKQRVLADLSSFEDYKILNKGNGFPYGFALNKYFSLNIEIATRKEISKVNYEIYFNKFFRKLFPKFSKKYIGASKLAHLRAIFIPKYKKLKKKYITNSPFNSYNGNIWRLDENEDYYLNGLWQNINYETKMKNDFPSTIILNPKLSERAKTILNKITTNNSVAMHVRRGDFVIKENKFRHDLCGVEYYQEAIKILKNINKDYIFYVFSDDIEYCKKMFSNLENIIYVSENGFSTDVDLFLISKCKAAIIPNSTFALWGARLNDNSKKIVICPKYFLRTKDCWCEFSVPNHWIKIENL
jgi:hypothetical protein